MQLEKSKQSISLVQAENNKLEETYLDHIQ